MSDLAGNTKDKFSHDAAHMSISQDIEALLKSEARHSDHRTADCFVLIVCSHGTAKGIYGVDGKIITYEEIFAIFNAQNCSSLAGKPKLIFLQACHGGKSLYHMILLFFSG